MNPQYSERESGKVPPAVEKRGEIPTLMGEAVRALSGLQTAIQTFEEKLKTVLEPSVVSEKPCSTPTPCTTTLGGQIAELVGGILSARERIIGLTEHLGV